MVVLSVFLQKKGIGPLGVKCKVLNQLTKIRGKKIAKMKISWLDSSHMRRKKHSFILRASILKIFVCLGFQNII